MDTSADTGSFRSVLIINEDSTKTRLTEIGGTGQNVAKMIVVHVLGTGLLDVGLELLETLSPALPARLHITVLLHRDNAEMVLLIDPDLN